MRLWFQPQGCDLNLEAVLWASRLWFEPQGCDLSLKAMVWASRLGFEPWGWDLSPKARIWALRLGFEPRGWNFSFKGGERRRLRRRNFSVYESIGKTSQDISTLMGANKQLYSFLLVESRTAIQPVAPESTSSLQYPLGHSVPYNKSRVLILFFFNEM